MDHSVTMHVSIIQYVMLYMYDVNIYMYITHVHDVYVYVHVLYIIINPSVGRGL